MLRVLIAAAAALAVVSTASAARQARTDKGLEKLDPSARFEQVCDIEAMTRIGRDKASHKPDRAVAYALGEPSVEGDVIEAPGAAFRSAGKWYRMTFRCKASPDRMRVEEFSYTVGAEIPEEDWLHLGLPQ